MNWVSLVLFFILSFSPFIRPALACNLTVQIMAFPPLAMKDELGHWSGLNVDYIKALFDKANCKYSFIEAPFARGLKMLKNGDADMTVNISMLDNRKQYLHFIGPQRLETILLVSKKKSIPIINTWQNFSSTKAVLIRQRGAYLGTKLEDVLDLNTQLEQRVVLFTNNEARIEMLKKGRADGFFIESTYLFHQLKNNVSYDLIEIHPLVINQEPVYFAFSKASVSTKVIERFTKAFFVLKVQGIFDQIEAKYSKYK